MPITTTRAMAGMAAAPMDETANGTMPVTRMVPASPMTNAPHQFVPRLREVATSGVLVTAPFSLMGVSPRVGSEGHVVSFSCLGSLSGGAVTGARGQKAWR
jgi:hypothetical protein